jgi:hypothetical protein
MGWIYLVQDRDQLQTFINLVLGLVSIEDGKFLD